MNIDERLEELVAQHNEWYEGLPPEAQTGTELEAAAPALAQALLRARQALVARKREHLVVDEDCWFSCPVSGRCCNEALDPDLCNCGTSLTNALIDEVLADTELEEALQ